MEFLRIPRNCSCHRNWRTRNSMEFHGFPWNCWCHKNWHTPSSMELHGTARVSEIGTLQVPWNSMASWTLWVLNFDRIAWNLSFQIVMRIISDFAEWINFRKLISTLYRFVSLFHQLMFHYKYLHYTICISGNTNYVSKYHSEYIFNAHWNLFWLKSSKSSMELSPEFHGTFWTTFEQHLWFHGIPWNLRNKTSSSMEFHGILSKSKVPWNSTELFPYSRVPWNSMEFFLFSP